MKIKIGLMHSSPVIEELLNQEMIPWEFVKWNNISVYEFSTIIVNSRLPMIEGDRIRAYLEAGGAVLIFTGMLDSLIKIALASVRVKSMIPETNTILDSCDLLDIYGNINIADTSKIAWLDRGLKIQTKNYGDGVILSLPFDFDKLLTNFKSLRKQFYDPRKELPSERVAKISKGTLRKVFVRSLQYLFDKRNIPYCHTAYNTSSQPNFIFRIDTDFCSKQDAMSLYELLRENDIKATWFVDTSDKEMLENLYKQLADQEIGLHCSRHMVFIDYKSNEKNVSAGIKALQDVGIEVKSFAAPYGEWNPTLNRVLQEKGFLYSSEFGWDYDNLPSYPIVNNEKSTVLQIPIHPISIGRLVRSHYSSKEIFNYFKRVIDHKINEGVPVIIYYHPHRGLHDVLAKIFNYIKQKKLNNITMEEYALWWIDRLNTPFNASFEDDLLQVTSEKEELTISIKKLDKNAYLKTDFSAKLDELNWQNKKIDAFIAVERTRKANLRTILYDYESIRGKLKQ